MPHGSSGKEHVISRLSSKGVVSRLEKHHRIFVVIIGLSSSSVFCLSDALTLSHHGLKTGGEHKKGLLAQNRSQ